MEQLINDLDFQSASSENVTKLKVALDNLRKNGGIKTDEIGKCLNCLHAKICVPNFPNDQHAGFNCALLCMKELINSIK